MNKTESKDPTPLPNIAILDSEKCGIIDSPSKYNNDFKAQFNLPSLKMTN